MNLRQLEVFVAVAETESFSRAADQLHVVQSAVSASIRTLEQELGAELLVRTGRGARPTDAGWRSSPRRGPRSLRRAARGRPSRRPPPEFGAR